MKPKGFRKRELRRFLEDEFSDFIIDSIEPYVTATKMIIEDSKIPQSHRNDMINSLLNRGDTT